MITPSSTIGLSLSETIPSKPEDPEIVWCERMGWRSTEPRRVIIRAICSFSGYFDAEGLLARARELQAGIARATVCRMLSALGAARILHTTEFGDGCHRYCVEDPDAPPMAEIFVQECGKVVRVPAPFLGWYAETLTEKAGFEPVGQRLQVFARCGKRHDDADACASCAHRHVPTAVEN